MLLASNEGLPIAHSFSNGADPNRVAAMAAAASSLGRRISDNMSAGTLGEVSIQADEGALFVYSAGNKAVLAVISPQGGNAGLIHLEARMRRQRNRRSVLSRIPHAVLSGSGDHFTSPPYLSRAARPATRANSSSGACRTRSRLPKCRSSFVTVFSPTPGI